MSKIITRVLVLLLAIGVGIYAIIQYGLYSPQQAGLVSIKLRQPDFHLEPWIYVLYAHIATGVLALVIGPFQLFLKPADPRRERRHRLFGYVYVIAVTVSGIVNLYLAPFATGGWTTGLGFFLLDVLWVSTTWIALAKIVKNKVRDHKEWMLRSYALTFAAVSLRLWLPLLLFVYHGNFVAAYQVVAWLCWTLNLLVIEGYIQLRRQKTARLKVSS